MLLGTTSAAGLPQKPSIQGCVSGAPAAYCERAGNAMRTKEITMADVVARSFRTAYLLTNSTEEAESAVLAGIESWNPDGESDEALFHKVMCAAARSHHQWEPPVRTGALLWLPEELRVVLTLAPPIRRCFVL